VVIVYGAVIIVIAPVAVVVVVVVVAGVAVGAVAIVVRAGSGIYASSDRIHNACNAGIVMGSA